MLLKFDEWKERVFKRELFNDIYEHGKQQKLAATMSGVRAPLGTFTHGFFTHKKSTPDMPTPDAGHKVDKKPR